MTTFHHERRIGIAAALGAALLFGAGTPLAKVLLGRVDPWLLAALLYLGSGIGLLVLRLAARSPRPHLALTEWLWLAAATVAGGVVAPLALMWGLYGMPAAGASLLLNAESVFTALLAWFVFRENFDRRIALGMVAIVAGSVVLTWPGEARLSLSLPALAVLGACLAWALDNNLTRKAALADASFIAMAKGLAAGSTNLALALGTGAAPPVWPDVAAAALLGLLSYGLSLTLFVIALRHLGSARTGAYFSTAPFVGAALAVALLGDPITPTLLLAGGLMALGVILHLTEHHSHRHEHHRMEHGHWHTHGPGDPHHDHQHDEPVRPGTRHTHWHQHEPLAHSHPHFPDAHHRHDHD
ncbi:DMT family transporter [Methylotetracoccus oryzae]|uniref:DMT family transporter n=1 Tax=Methylotetracoccus oryzae TaxID=1919059 RepID=UPI001119FC9C|nr:DMT family transporter [Methylotetracoccus oryzae]